MKYVCRFNTNVKFDYKYAPKTRLIILISRIEPGHCPATLLKYPTFRAANFGRFPLLEQLLSRSVVNERKIRCTFCDTFL